MSVASRFASGVKTLIVLSSVFLAAPALGQDAPTTTARAYKAGEAWPLRCFEGIDALEPLWPGAAFARGDAGRITLDTALPIATIAAAFAARGTDEGTLLEVGRWRWVGLDEKENNYPLLYATFALSGISILLPSPEDAGGFSWALRLDRATVLGLGLAVTEGETELLQLLYRRPRPGDPSSLASRPSSHASSAGAAAAFASDVLRDALRPQDEARLGVRVLEETTTALPYLGAAYISLERVHGRKHFLTDTLLGAGLGALTMHMFYAWSFTREEEGRGWLETASIGAGPGEVSVAFSRRF